MSDTVRVPREPTATELLREVFTDAGCRIVNHDDSRVVTAEWVNRVTDHLCGRGKIGMQDSAAPQSSSDAAGWIPVGERLPDEFGEPYVLVVVDGRKINPEKNKPHGPRIGIGHFHKEWPAGASKQRDYWAVSDEAGRYFGCRWLDKESIAIWGEITHWMPLPSPPEKDKP